VDERAVTELRRLAEADADLSGRASALRALDGQIAEIRSRAETIDAFFADYPAAETSRRAELTDAQAELVRRKEELADAERRLGAADDDEARIHAEFALARARDHVAVADSRIERAKASYDELERNAAALPPELGELEQRARAVPDVPPLATSLVEWASHAHAELFVAAGQIDAERERVIREAHELATMLLGGEPTYGSTVAQALARVEAHWTSLPGHVSESK
jgi:DNA repair exonuclease SbcCD ATPase subunit